MAMTKITMLGDGGVGKSALTVRFYNDEWVGDAYDPTVEDMYRKQTDVDNKPSVLNILDTSGQEEYSAMADHWIRQGDGYCLVFSMTSRKSFARLDDIITKITRVRDVAAADSLPIVLVANKSDLVADREVSVDEAGELAKKLSCELIVASAKENFGVTQTFESVIRSYRSKVAGSVHESTTPRKMLRFSAKDCSIL